MIGDINDVTDIFMAGTPTPGVTNESDLTDRLMNTVVEMIHVRERLFNFRPFIKSYEYSQIIARMSGLVNDVYTQVRSSKTQPVGTLVLNLDKIIKDTAKGKGNWSEVLRNQNDVKETESSLFFSLTPRQRSILTLCTTGNSPQEIAKQLGISYSYVRKELSRAYAILLPDADQGSDLKTAAVLKYMELLRMS
jgi:hypothetical protein